MSSIDSTFFSNVEFKPKPVGYIPLATLKSDFEILKRNEGNDLGGGSG
jgi:hypothetical protein